MPITFFVLTAGFWILLVLEDASLVLGFAGLWAIFLYLRLKKPFVLLLWALLAGFALYSCTRPVPPDPGPGTYVITEVRSGYAIARSGESALLYQNEEVTIHDTVEITHTEPLESLRNLGLFDFAGYMRENGITHRGSGSVIFHSSSLQARMMRACRSSPARMAAFYGIREEESLLERAGLPVLAALLGLERLLAMRLPKPRAQVITMILAMIWGMLFLWPLALVRWLFFRFFRCLSPDRLISWSLSVLAFLLLLPERSASFSLVFPALLQLCSLFRQKGILRCLLVFLQGLYFRTLSPLGLFGYGLLKKLALAAFVLAVFDIPLDLNFAPPEIPVYVGLPVILLFVTGCKGVLLRQKKLRVLLPCFLVMLAGWHLDPFFHVYMLDVGQGDCTLIVEPFRKSAVMIDAAGNLYRDNADRIILPFLESIGIRHLDALVVTHEDFDHSGAVKDVTDVIQTDAVIRDPHQVIDVGYPMQILLPDREADDENEGSLVTLFSHDGFGYLWTGDAGVQTEALLMEAYRELPVTVLKAGHHGSDTASSFAFLDWLRPELCLLSVGAHNRYGHPSPSVLASLQTLNIPAFSTASSGMIHLFSWHGLLFMETADGQIGLVQTAASRQ